MLTSYAYGFRDEHGKRIPNWREHLLCENCGLNNRMRAAIQLFEQLTPTAKGNRIYITEQTTPLYRWIKKEYPHLEGSEYLGGRVPFGTCDEHGIRNETLTDLRWSRRQFDFILSFDVFEHIPNYRQAFTECARVLKPNGQMLFTVPFRATERRNLVRARVTEDGKVEHLLPAEYHGDPLSQAGCLAYYHFGWELLDEIRECGFSDTEALFYWSRELGYLGLVQNAFLATRASE